MCLSKDKNQHILILVVRKVCKVIKALEHEILRSDSTLKLEEEHQEEEEHLKQFVSCLTSLCRSRRVIHFRLIRVNIPS